MKFPFFTEQFSEDLEKEYRRYQIQNAETMVRFIYIIAGLLPFVLLFRDMLQGDNRFGLLNSLDLFYFIFWGLIIYMTFNNRYRLNMRWSIIIFVIVTTLFLSLSNALSGTDVFNSILPVPLFFLFGIVISQVGVQLTVVVGLISIFIPFMFSLEKLPEDFFASILMLVIWFVLAAVASVILDKNNRYLFKCEKEITKTRDLTEDLLNEAFKANEAKSRFLANMSHEIRTPLTSIIGYAESAIENQSPHHLHETLKIIKRNSKHLLSIINDILDLSKIEADQFKVEHIPYPLFEITTSVENLMSKVAASKNLMFDVSYQFPLPEFIYCDPTRIKQVLLNLTNNAIKFTETGGVTIKIMVASGQNKLKIAVADTGIGMTPEEVNRVFDAFTQADTSTSRKYGGTGLGLHLSKQLLKSMNGTIALTSEKNKGSTFTIELPLQVPSGIMWLNTVPEVFYTEQHSVPTELNQELKGHLLLAEDNKDNQNLIKSILQNMGLEVTAVDNGEQAVEQALSNDFDLILMDIQMPIMDGMKAVKMLRMSGDSTPIVALTANVMQHEIKEYQQNGFDDYLAKPIVKEIFIATIQKYVQTRATENDLIDRESEEYLALKQQYIASLKTEYESLLKQMAIENWHEIASICHSIKGTAGNYGFGNLSLIAGKIEKLVKSNDVDEIYSSWVQLCTEIEKALP